MFLEKQRNVSPHAKLLWLLTSVISMLSIAILPFITTPERFSYQKRGGGRKETKQQEASLYIFPSSILIVLSFFLFLGKNSSSHSTQLQKIYLGPCSESWCSEVKWGASGISSVYKWFLWNVRKIWLRIIHMRDFSEIFCWTSNVWMHCFSCFIYFPLEFW